MLVLTLRFTTDVSPVVRAILQEVAAAPPPDVLGLRARHWRAERRGARGRYVFEDRASLDAFARDPAPRDPAIAMLAPHALGPGVAVGSVEESWDETVLQQPIFIISAPRAGSTLLQELLARSGELWTTDGEAHGVIEGIPALHPARRGFESDRLTEVDATADIVRTLRAGLIAELRNHRGKRYLDLPPGGRPTRVRLLEKTPENALRVAFLLGAFPDARFVLLHRDPRQNVSSILEAWAHEGFTRFPDLPGWTRHRWCFLLPPGWRRLDGAPLSDVSAFQWRAACEHALDDLASAPREQWTSVEYSDLVSAPEQVVRELCRFFGTAFDAPLADALSRPLRPSSTTLTPPSPIKWRGNRELLASSLAGLGPLAGRLRHLSARPELPPRAVRLSSVRYACFLENVGGSPAPPSGAIVNPSLELQLGPTVPLSILHRTRHRERFVPDHPLLWIEDPATRILYPFWAQRRDAAMLRLLQPGRPPPPLDAALSAGLARASVLIAPSEVEARRERGEALVHAARHTLERDRLCTVPTLLTAAHVAALARYFRALIDSGRWALGDAQVARRRGWHNEPIAGYFHLQLTDVVRRIAGEPVRPTYCYASAYRGGAALRAHTDRKQCEYTLSLLVDHCAPSSLARWPLWFQAPSGPVSVTLDPGDAVLFRGCELPHWRAAAPSDQEQITLLFHYVPVAFADVRD